MGCKYIVNFPLVRGMVLSWKTVLVLFVTVKSFGSPLVIMYRKTTMKQYNYLYYILVIKLNKFKLLNRSGKVGGVAAPTI